MKNVTLTQAQHDALERLNEAIVDRVLDHHAVARNQILVGAAQTFLALQAQGKVALGEDRVYFDPSVDVDRLASAVFDQIVSGTLTTSEQAQALAAAFAKEQQRAKEQRQRERANRLLEDVVTTIGVLYGPQEVSDPYALAQQMLEHDAGAFAKALEGAKIRALAPQISAYLAGEPTAHNETGEQTTSTQRPSARPAN